MVKISRCAWCGEDEDYVAYHDVEWGVPTRDPGVLFELLVLEGMQAGLSWRTVLRKREHMRRSFLGFDIERLDREGPALIDLWLADPGLIRHRGKLQAVIDNARACLDLDSGLPDLLWSFVDGRPVQNRWRDSAEVPASSSRSDAMSKALRKAGFRFVGPTTCYALMQAAGMVNDHLISCYRHAECEQLARAWID